MNHIYKYIYDIYIYIYIYIIYINVCTFPCIYLVPDYHLRYTTWFSSQFFNFKAQSSILQSQLYYCSMDCFPSQMFKCEIPAFENEMSTYGIESSTTSISSKVSKLNVQLSKLNFQLPELKPQSRFLPCLLRYVHINYGERLLLGC